MKNVEYTKCDSCGRNEYIFLYDVSSWEHEGVFKLVKCRNCNLVYFNPRPIPKEIHKYYGEDTYWGDITSKESLQDFKTERKKNFSYLYNILLRDKSEGKILDIGAGKGIFLSRFREEGWNVSGVELSKAAVRMAKKNFGIVLKQGDLLDFKYKKEEFDLVTLNNALEHLYSPKKTLKEVNRILKDTGAVLITVPNINSFGAEIFRRNWYALQPPRHLYHFSPNTLSSLLESTGFQVKHIYYDYKVHNYFTLYESFRILFSPRFKKNEKGGLAQNMNSDSKKSLKKELGKIIDYIFSVAVSNLGALLGRGEVMVIYAEKKS